MSLLLLDGTPPQTAIVTRAGLVRAGHKVLGDDTGIFHPLGLTFFWALYGWKYERQRILDHLAWLAPKGYDYLRILGEVDWTGRSIDPPVEAGNTTPAAWPDYRQILREFVDVAYDRYGLRSEITIVGGRQFDKNTGARRFVPTDFARVVAEALVGAEHKVLHYEAANEWSRLDKVGLDDLVDMAHVIEGVTPNLVALSRPDDYGDMMAATEVAGASAFTLHPRRSDHDHGWSHVRQGYDFKDFPRAVFNNEPEGPQSSVEEMSNPLQLACCRLLGIVCGGAGYVLHVGQGVTGEADEGHGRPQEMWDVPNIDEIMRVVRACDPLLPLGIENWKCVNNGRSDHPLPLDGHTGFWEGTSGEDARAPAVNKNYAAISGTEFVVMLIGCKSVEAVGPVPAGTAIRPCHVEAFDPVTLAKVAEADLAAGQSWTVPGRADTMAAAVVRGHYLGVQRRARDRYV